MQAGAVEVQTTSGRGASPEEVAERCLNKLVYVSDTAPEPVRQQVNAFRDSIRVLLVEHMREAIKSDRVTIQNKLTRSGQAELADIIRRL